MTEAKFEFLKALTCSYVGEEQGGTHTFGGVHSDDISIDIQSEAQKPIEVVLFLRPLEMTGQFMIALEGDGARSLRRAEFDGTDDGRPEISAWDRLVMHFEVPQRLIKPGTIKVLVGTDRDDLRVVHQFRIFDTSQVAPEAEVAPP